MSLGRRATTRATAPPRTTAAPPGHQDGGVDPAGGLVGGGDSHPPARGGLVRLHGSVGRRRDRLGHHLRRRVHGLGNRGDDGVSGLLSEVEDGLCCLGLDPRASPPSSTLRRASEGDTYVRVCVCGSSSSGTGSRPSGGAGRGVGRGERKEGLTTREASGPSLARATYFRRRLDERTRAPLRSTSLASSSHTQTHT